jgi:hypothetical protein
MNNLSKNIIKFILVGALVLGFLSGTKYLSKHYITTNNNETQVNFIDDEVTEQKEDIAKDETKAVEPIVYEVQADESNAFELLKDSQEIEFKEYDFGVFVESINGIAGDSKHFWALYVNNEKSLTGADQTTVNKGDTVEWRYEEVK